MNGQPNVASKETENLLSYEEVVKWAQNPPQLKPDVRPVGWTIMAAGVLVLLWYFFLYRRPRGETDAEEEEEENEEEEEEKEEKTAESETTVTVPVTVPEAVESGVNL